MKGASGPSLRGVGDKHDKDAIMKIIKEGFNGRMPAQYDSAIAAGLTDKDIDNLADWLSKQKAEAK
jgi:menaquinol-cytochrome c reductase cytochrome b/c subunit